MSNVASSSPILRRIQASGVLRVGTTGDYTPFTLLRPDGSYIGADIDMTHDLAERLGIDIEFVPSVWIDLLDHFLADRFDIAIGGVTVTAPRAEKAFFFGSDLCRRQAAVGAPRVPRPLHQLCRDR